jgi:hypothetical protein
MLHVHLLEGRGLSPAPSRRFCSPCVQISSGAVVRRSRAVDSHLAPAWNQYIDIPLADPVVFAVIDADPFGADTALAEHSLAASSLAPFEITDAWLPLTPGPAELHLALQRAPAGHPRFQPAGARARPPQIPALVGPSQPDGAPWPAHGEDLRALREAVIERRRVPERMRARGERPGLADLFAMGERVRSLISGGLPWGEHPLVAMVDSDDTEFVWDDEAPPEPPIAPMRRQRDGAGGWQPQPPPRAGPRPPPDAEHPRRTGDDAPDRPPARTDRRRRGQ